MKTLLQYNISIINIFLVKKYFTLTCATRLSSDSHIEGFQWPLLVRTLPFGGIMYGSKHSWAIALAPVDEKIIMH